MKNPPWPWAPGQHHDLTHRTAAPVSGRGDLAYRDTISAAVDGTLHVLGTVAEIHPCLDVLWVIDGIGQRHLIEFERYQVHLVARFEEPSHPHDPGHLS